LAWKGRCPAASTPPGTALSRCSTPYAHPDHPALYCSSHPCRNPSADLCRTSLKAGQAHSSGASCLYRGCPYVRL
jgi:hypothetical protein